MLETYMSKYKEIIDKEILSLIATEKIPQALKESMCYSIEIGGKRIRPLLLFLVLEAFGKRAELGYKTAAALEMIHTYSLVHDDLPAMDDDDMRRGKPTNHKVYGEATAILAGDGLLTHAFTIISRDEELTFKQRLDLIEALSYAAGPSGMIAGQMLDMEAENKKIELDQLKQIHRLKTGRLIEFAVVAGGIIAEVDQEIIKRLQKFAGHLGLAFQIQDDILDIEGDTALIGKPIGSDLINEKSTYVSLTSVKEAKKMLEIEIEAALDLLRSFPIETKMLEEITMYIKIRQS